jgi:2'-5' RNA ligase
VTVQQRFDSMARALDLLGTNRQPGVAGFAGPTLDACAIDATLVHSWTGRREIVVPMGDLTRKGVELADLPEWVDAKAVKSAIEGDPHKRQTEGHAGLLSAFTEWWGVGIAYGGALLVPIVEDGREPWEPLDLANVQTIRSWEVLDRYECCPFRRTQGGPVEYWLLATSRELVTSARQVLHPSRVLPHWGDWMPPRWRAAFGGWGMSRLELLQDLRAAIDIGDASLGRFLDRFHQDVVTLGELQELLEGSGGAEALALRLSTMFRALRNLGVLLLDGGRGGDDDRGEVGRKGDTFQSVARPVSGVTEVAAHLGAQWRKGWGAPEIVADGIAGGGLNSGEEAGQWRAWDGAIEAEQQLITAKFVWCADLVFAAQDGPTQGRMPGDYTVKWGRLAGPDHKHDAEVDKLEAEADQIRVDSGTLRPTEIRSWRNVDGKHGVPQVENVEMLPEPGDVDVAAEMQANAAAELVGAAGDVQQQALNGAQIEALRELVSSVANGQLPASAAEWLVSLAVPGIDIERARAALAAASAFTPAPAASSGLPTQDAVDVGARLLRAFRVDVDQLASRADAAGWARDIVERLDSYPNGGVFIRVPNKLAVQFPYKPDDDSPPHVTVLFCGPITWDEHQELRKVVAEMTADWKPVAARFAGLNYFPREDGGRVAWVAVEFDPELAGFQERLRLTVGARGVQVRHHPGPWVAHATLAYLGPGEEYTGPVPTGEWTVGHLEVWHGQERGG